MEVRNIPKACANTTEQRSKTPKPSPNNAESGVEISE
jgi:hypothetical protein